ncbi:flagellar basal-body rod protein FlgF [Desulfallas sp. Bu1-1]|uniref:flagellar basal-body rod protein FlgF n=1 Tax=Desulfallas sp. Bu1-1 TaxID=2787620 RepID=UPI00189F237C|nr:flagellar basal-body rod protein FlgF [Desulfallas sp. Bu1-1]MBF7081956.1 flagellar basal-body rod protein FlgF [Desulfallas sp. Bu1-1]
MLRSLFSGVSGMRAHQMRMDVIGNNIANVNTTGFKSSRANFQDVIYQTLRGGGKSTNPVQIGTGSKIGSTSANFTPGALQNTNRTLDLAIQGNGLFILTDGTNKYYTRDGAFFIDSTGQLVNADGLKVCGADGNTLPSLGTSINSISIDDQGRIYINGNTDPASAPQIGIATCPNYEGLSKKGNNLYEATVSSGTVTHTTATNAGCKINSGYLEMSNVDLSDEFANMITTQRGFQANARVITVSDTLLEELIQLKR